MTPEELRAARLELGLSKPQLARKLDLGANGRITLDRYERGERLTRSDGRVPGPVATAVHLLLEAKRLRDRLDALLAVPRAGDEG